VLSSAAKTAAATIATHHPRKLLQGEAAASAVEEMENTIAAGGRVAVEAQAQDYALPCANNKHDKSIKCGNW
jgi:hypothetical protein